MIQHKFKRKILIWQLTNRGFGSEINNLLYAINYSSKKKYELDLETSSWNFRIKDGWNDYFLSIDSSKNKNFSKFLLILINKFIGISSIIYYDKSVNMKFKSNASNIKITTRFKFHIYILLKKIFLFLKPKGKYFIFEKFYEVRKFCLLERNLNKKKFILNIHEILINLWKFKEGINLQIQNKKIQIEEDYAVFHIRRGDKIETQEDNYYNVKDYVKYFNALNTDINTIFIMGDDYSVFTELNEKFPNYNFLTLIDSEEDGHLQSDFNKKNNTKKEIAALNLLTEIEIARDCEVFIGSQKSNIFRLIEYFKINDCHDISDGTCEYII